MDLYRTLEEPGSNPLRDAPRSRQGIHRDSLRNAQGLSVAYFPEANVLVPVDSQAEGSGTPTRKATEIEIRACGN